MAAGEPPQPNGVCLTRSDSFDSGRKDSMAECKFNKVLVANRGEIAIRVFRACDRSGPAHGGHVLQRGYLFPFRTKADEAYLIGENRSPLGAYLDIPAIIDAGQAHAMWTPSTPATASCPRTPTSPGPARRRASSSSARPSISLTRWATSSTAKEMARRAAAYPSSPAATSRSPKRGGGRAHRPRRYGYPRDPQGGSRRRRPRYAPRPTTPEEVIPAL